MTRRTPFKTSPKPLSLALACVSLLGWLPGWLLGNAQIVSGAEVAALTSTEPRVDEFRDHVLPFLESYCFECHKGKKPKAGLDLTLQSSTAIARTKPEIWDELRWLLEEGEMPPASQAQPPPADSQRVLTWIDSWLPRDSQAELQIPGRPVLRRLNNTEYERTVRHLFGVHYPANEHFPADGIGRGFDNAGDALSIPDVLFERYLIAAETVASEAFVTTDLPKDRLYGVDELEGEARGRAIALPSVGNATAGHVFPRAGEYEIVVRAFARQAGPDVARMELFVAGKSFKTFDVAAVEGESGTYRTIVKAPPGSQTIAARFINDYYRPENPDPKNRDRNLYVISIAVRGPLDPAPLSRYQRDLFEEYPESLGRRRTEKMLQAIATRVWRRPPTKGELGRLERLAGKEKRLPAGLRLALTGLLSSPHFLFKVELDAKSGETRSLNDWELASRLSYFLWSSTPDKKLLDLASAGELVRTEVLEAEIVRMLRDPRARALADNFATQWLQIRALDTVDIDLELHPEFTPELRAAMRRETVSFFEYLLRTDQSLWDLLDADYSFMDDELAGHYGIAGVTGKQMRRVSLEGTARRGVLGQGSVLTATSNPTRTSPVKRGKWVLDVLLGAAPPDPPPEIPALDESSEAVAAASQRERLELHRKNPDCAVCHDGMDPLGFGLENYGVTGAWREVAEGFPVDASGVLPGGRSFDGPVELVSLLRRSGGFLSNLVERLTTYGLGRSLGRPDRALLRSIEDGLDPVRPTLQQVLRGIILSDAFRMRGDAPSSAKGRGENR